jgi:hypothetical protein
MAKKKEEGLFLETFSITDMANNIEHELKGGQREKERGRNLYGSGWLSGNTSLNWRKGQSTRGHGRQKWATAQQRRTVEHKE